MKKMILAIVLGLLVISITSDAQEATKQTASNSGFPVTVNGPVATFNKTVFEFADLTQGIPATASFILTNDGNEPLIISSGSASCGCTNLSYSKEPILPGKAITISATYNAASVGPFNKSVTIRTNASDKPVVLQIRGKVIPKS